MGKELKGKVMTKKEKTMKVYLVSKSMPDYDCGSACTEIIGNKGYKTKKMAYDVMIADILKEMGLKSIDQVPNKSDYDGCRKLADYGIEDWGIPEDENDSTHKTCDGYLETCDGEITYDIQELVVEG